MVIIRAKMSIKQGKMGAGIQDSVAELVRVIPLSCRQETLMRLTRRSNVDLRHHIILLDMMTVTDERDENRSWLELRVCRFQIWAVSWERQPGWRAGRLAGWLAGRTVTWEPDWASWDGVYPPPTNPLTANRLGGQSRRQSSLPSAALLGVCSADSDWGASTLSAAWRTPVFLPTGLEDTEPWQI